MEIKVGKGEVREPSQNVFNFNSLLTMEPTTVSLKQHSCDVPLSAEHSKQYVKDGAGTAFQMHENLIVSSSATLD